jgi:hypothetical protein
MSLICGDCRARKIANCAMTLMLLVTLLWGGCLSCAQYFMFPGLTAKDCCAPSSHCKNRPAPASASDCNIQAVAMTHQQAIPDHAANLTAAATPVLSAVVPVGPAVAAIVTRASLISPDPPDDLALLNSVFRI